MRGVLPAAGLGQCYMLEVEVEIEFWIFNPVGMAQPPRDHDGAARGRCAPWCRRPARWLRKVRKSNAASPAGWRKNAQPGHVERHGGFQVKKCGIQTGKGVSLTCLLLNQPIVFHQKRQTPLFSSPGLRARERESVGFWRRSAPPKPPLEGRYQTTARVGFAALHGNRILLAEFFYLCYAHRRVN